MKLFKGKATKTALIAAALAITPTVAFAAGGNLESNDFVGISFWLISMALVASTAFFFIETQRVEGKWKTSLTVSGLVTWSQLCIISTCVMCGYPPVKHRRYIVTSTGLSLFRF